MKKLAALFCALSLSFSVFSQSDETPYLEGELLVMMEKGESIHSLINQFSYVNNIPTGILIERELSKLSNIHHLKFDPQSINDKQLLELIRDFSTVRAAQFNHFVQERLLPNDPDIGTQWHHVDGSDNDIDSDLAWDITTGGTTANGDDIVVCVIEGGGSNYNHTDIIDNHWTNQNEIDGNGVDDDGNGFIDDVNGWNSGTGNDNIAAGNHGAQVSGMIGAKGDNNQGGSGVNWDVKIMQVDMAGISESNVIAAYNYPYTMRNLYNTTNGANGAFVVATNASWGIDNGDPANYPLWCAYYDDLGSVGLLNCGATANNNVNIDVVGDMPTGCGSDYMIAVTATNSSDVRTFSGYGATTIDLGAPGEAVWLPTGGSGYGSTSGTSFASPCVAGGIALMYSAPCPDIAALALTNPQAAADQMRLHLLNGVDVVPNLVGECVTGGRLNVRNSIDLVLGNCGPLPPCNATGLSLSSDCYYDTGLGSIQASITVDVTMSEAFCTATEVCYALSGGGFSCDDLVALGITLDNNNTYTISGLAPNTSYDVYFSTADDTSSIVTITTADCSGEIAGCTDPNADNYNASATLDDGSCTYTCTNLTLTIDTDCWGGEVSWEILDDLGNVVANVAGGTYGNQQQFTWNDCLNTGCYTFNIFDSFGDGLFGTGSGCAVDGNYVMTDDLGNTIFQMGDPNYGSGTSHNFCVPFAGLLGCTNPIACNYDPAAVVDDGSCIIPPGNDQCANAVPLAAGTTNITNINACVNEGATGSCHWNGDVEQLSVWYEITTPALPAEITIETVDDGTGTWNDTQFTLYDVCGGTELACDDDAGAGLYSLLFFNCGDLTPNTTYLLQVDGWNFDDGTCDIELTFDQGACGTVPGCTDPAACNYDPAATLDDGSCILPDGCTNPVACNFDPAAQCDDGTCILPDGCTDPAACNFDPAALCDDLSCLYGFGCTNPIACNFDPIAQCDDGSCVLPDGCTDPLACNYDPAAVCDDGSCSSTSGCTDPTACNYDPAAGCDDGSCDLPDGCTNPTACNYDHLASCDDGSCSFDTGCTNPAACNYDPTAACDDGSCLTLYGCTNNAACNYDPVAQCDDGSCNLPDGCTNLSACNYDPAAQCDDGSCDFSCGCPADLNNSGAVDVNDLLMFLAAFGCVGPNCVGDFNSSGATDAGDLLTFLSAYGTICP